MKKFCALCENLCELSGEKINLHDLSTDRVSLETGLPASSPIYFGETLCEGEFNFMIK